MIPDDDRGLMLGDGLFETLLSLDGDLQFFDEHLARMVRACAIVGIAPPDASDARDAAHAAASGVAGRAAIRLTLTAGSGRGLERPANSMPRLIATASPAPLTTTPVRLRTSSIRRNPTSPASRLKTLSYLDNVLARRQARDEGADEALMLNVQGEIACAAAANLFWIAADRLHTPALDCGVLDGIMRAQVIAAAAALGVETIEARAAPNELDGAEAAFLTNSLIGVRPVAAIDGRSLGVHRLAEVLSRSGR